MMPCYAFSTTYGHQESRSSLFPRSDLDFWAQKFYSGDGGLIGRRDSLAEDDTFDLGDDLGASGANSVQRLTLYIPSRDRDGRDILDVARWIDEGKRLLADICGGYTALPPFDGGG